MMLQPSPPPAPAAPVFNAQDRTDLAQTVREAQQLGREAQTQALRELQQANRQAGQTNASVIKDPGGRIVVTGPDGRTITIDPKAGLDGDQIQEMVQTALRPVRPELPRDHGPSGTAVGMVAIVFVFLFLIAVVISRTVLARRRPLTAGASTAVLPPETVARLARIEQAVEAVAIEVERISEAQRYSAQLLTDRLAGPAQTAPAVAAVARGDHA